MRKKLVVLPIAEADLKESAKWYESERPGLGQFFLRTVRTVFRKINSTPLQFPAVAMGVRRALVPRFPYGVFFRASERATVVIAVIHLHRHPGTWRERS